MQKVGQAVLGAVASGIIVMNCVFTIAWSSEEFLPRSAEQLTLPRLHSHLAAERVDILVGRWLAQMDPADVDGSIAAIELLDGAPKAFVDAAVSRLRKSGDLEKIFAAGNAAQVDRLRNSVAINQSGLRDLLWRDYLLSLQSALAAKSEIDVIALMPSAEFMQPLPEPVAVALLAALEDGQLGNQARDETSRLLIRKWDSLGDEVSRLRGWLSAQDVQGDGSANRKQVARSVLARLGQPLSGEDLGILLSEGDAGSRMAALDQLKSNEPQRWAQLYDDIQQTTALETWDLASIDHFIEAAGLAQAATLDGWSATIKLSSSPGDELECADLRWRLSLLSRQSTPRGARFEMLWNLLSKRSSCRDDISSEVDKALVAVAGGELRSLVMAVNDRDGPGQLANAPLRLPLVSQSISDLLEARLADGDSAGAERLLDLGVVPSAIGLEKLGYWTKAFSWPPARTVTVADLRALMTAKGAPSTAFETAAHLAADTTMSIPLRSTALLALAGRSESDLVAFISALSDSNAAIARPALILLAMSYDEAYKLKGLLVPDAELMGDVRTRPNLSAGALILLRSLVRYDQVFATGYADAIGEDHWRTKPGEPCLVLAEAPAATPQTLVPAFNALPTSDAKKRDAILACVLLLSEPRSATARLAKGWGGGAPEDAAVLLEGIRTLWEDEAFRSALSTDVITKLGQIVSGAVRDLPYQASSMQTLAYWRDQLAITAPNESELIASELRKQWIVVAIAAVPAGLMAHLALWVVLLTTYPRSPWIQAVVFWNPFVRKLLGLGYIDLVLLHVGFARRQLFAPFKVALLGDIVAENLTQLDRLSYFKDSRVRHRQTVTSRHSQAADKEMPILEALYRHRGRVLLLGKSGLGKSSFLRFSLAERAREGRDVIVYLRADQCRQGVEAEIEQRMSGLGKEQGLLRSMIYSGRIYVYIDGYNEVDLTTQDLITGFLSRYPYANILVASQIPLRGFGTIDRFSIAPLGADSIRAFLLSREAVLAEGALIRGDLFEKIATDFLQQVNLASQDDVERRAFDEILSNPMDLTSVAILLGDGRTPDLFALEAQQFEGISRRLAETGVMFRTVAFSSALLEQRLQDQENLQRLPFQPEVVALIAGKLALVRTDADEAGAVASQEVRFRHDRIRDFFTHFAFLAIDQETRTKYAEEARFSGVFPYLARALPPSEAEELRELLITRAAEIEDHRVSDSFVREYSWRQRIFAQDAEWMLSYDLPEAREADRKLFDLAARRQELSCELNTQRDAISKARGMTRILATADASAIRDAAIGILCAVGATAETSADGVATGVLRGPTGDSLRVVGLGQIGPIKSFHVEVLASRTMAADTTLLVVTNARVGQDPKDRPPDLDPADAQLLKRAGARVVSARDLYTAFMEARGKGVTEDFWRRPPFAQTAMLVEHLDQ
ncbi:MAG: hypothetical protein E5Y73_01940 [Mesorhizobium sp.]|uniref:hypothetical protein n=1 Tax=Mesorhizobium sp. TaxID=1871066 RepID=UPI0012201FEC|nr:hypothetical protein [Mesorhizobium sp.]TIL96293.1 MAG: hypothetical protein E5Y73_01940 [Mesorhizobium sp.]